MSITTDLAWAPDVSDFSLRFFLWPFRKILEECAQTRQNFFRQFLSSPLEMGSHLPLRANQLLNGIR